MNEEQSARMIELLEGIDAKLGNIYNMMKAVLEDGEEGTEDE